MKEVQYTIVNKNGVVGFIVIKELNGQKISVFASFENDYSENSKQFDVALVMQKAKSFKFNVNEDNELVVRATLDQSFSNYQQLEKDMGFHYWLDDFEEKIAELRKAIAQMKF